MARLLSLNVGLPREIAWNGKTVRTAIWKTPVTGRRMVRRLNVDGDGQADLAGHGGEQRAVFVYQQAAYRYWEKFLGRSDFVYGQFGENFTVEGLADDEVCIGDRFSIGDALFEITQPRVTCYRLGIRMNDPRMPALLVAHRRPGFYFRVLQEGEVGTGDEIVKISNGPEELTVAATDALLYLPGHSREQLEQALRIPALSKGWQRSFQVMLDQDGATSLQGNPGLVKEEDAPAWPGFEAMRVARVRKESDLVTSFELVPMGGQALPLAKPGQFVVLRLQVDRDQVPVIRSYSLSDLPSRHHFRISVKSETDGLGSSFLCNKIQEGNVLDVSAPRGSFTLRPGENPVVLLSAGIGVTPVISMLHALAAEGSARQVWWIYGARNGANHPFAEEARSLLDQLPHAHSYIVYSKPADHEKQGRDFDAAGRIESHLLEELGVPRDGDFYLCGPPSFLQEMRSGLREMGVTDEHIYMELFGAIEAVTPGMKTAPRPHAPRRPLGRGPTVSFARSGIAVSWDGTFESLLELAEACDIAARWSCRTGVCHLCTTGLVNGSIHYQPEPLERPGDGNVLLCCSRPDGNVVVDL